MLKALVIVPNERTKDVGDLLQIARAEIKKRHLTQTRPNVKVIKFVPECGVYVAVYKVPDVRKGTVNSPR